MKTNSTKYLYIVLIAIFLHTFSTYGQINDNNYSVKNRWTVKVSISSYKTAFHGQINANVGDNFVPFNSHRMANFKVEANYGINKFIELGLFTGFQHYEWIEDSSSDITMDARNKSFAPLFGVNANFHILPFFVKSKKCNWDLYLTTKYGGCYLPHKEIDQPDYPYRKYRHEYGLGLGINYYIKNIIGLFVEGAVGQFNFFNNFEIGIVDGTSLIFKDFSDSNFSIRIGIAAKILYQRDNTQKTQNNY